MSPLLIQELRTLASAQLNTPYGALPSLYAGANDQPPIQLLFDRFQQQCAAVTMMLLPLMTDALQVPLFVKSLPIGAVCARAVPAETAAMITVAMDKSARPEKHSLATIAVSFSMSPNRTSLHFQSSAWSLRASSSALGFGAPPADDCPSNTFRSAVPGAGVPMVE